MSLNRGSAIAKIVGTNARRHDTIDERVTMYVYEEIINGKKLTEIINETHENVKYLPGIKLPPNVVSCRDLLLAIVMNLLFINLFTLGDNIQHDSFFHCPHFLYFTCR
jgi:glycerol-3-phosphate dehydrogenase